MQIEDLNSLLSSENVSNIIDNLHFDNYEKYLFLGNNGFLLYKKNQINQYFLYQNITKIGIVFLDKIIRYNINEHILDRKIKFIPCFNIYIHGDYYTIYDDNYIELNQYIYHKMKFKDIKNVSDLLKWIFRYNYIENPKINDIKEIDMTKSMIKKFNNIRYKLIKKMEN